MGLVVKNGQKQHFGAKVKKSTSDFVKTWSKLQNWVPYGLVQGSMPEKFVFGVNPLNPLKTIENNRTPRSNAF